MLQNLSKIIHTITLIAHSVDIIIRLCVCLCGIVDHWRKRQDILGRILTRVMVLAILTFLSRFAPPRLRTNREQTVWYRRWKSANREVDTVSWTGGKRMPDSPGQQPILGQGTFGGDIVGHRLRTIISCLSTASLKWFSSWKAGRIWVSRYK